MKTQNYLDESLWMDRLWLGNPLAPMTLGSLLAAATLYHCCRFLYQFPKNLTRFLLLLLLRSQDHWCLRHWGGH
jgi:hypothetical protein